MAKKGLPVVIVDGAAVRTTFNDGKDDELADVMAEMKKQPTVRVAKVNDGPVDYGMPDGKGYDDEVYAKLQELGVRPYAEFAGANHQLLTQSRVDDSGNMYLYAYNYCPNDYHKHSILDDVKGEDHGRNIKTEIKMAGHYIPYSIDAWSGKVTELAQYRYEDGQTIFPIDLDYGNIALFAFEAVGSDTASIVSTNAASSYMGEDGPVIRATKSGKYTTSLSTGADGTNTITVPASYDIKDWDVTVTSWTGSKTVGDLVRKETIGDLETTNKKTSTVKTDIKVKLDKLKTWNKIPEVGKDVSGEGNYKASFNWDASKASGAYIDFGDSLDQSMKVWINGKKVGGNVSTNPTKVKKDVGGTVDNGKGEDVPLTGKDLYTGGIDWNTPLVDVGEYLVDGVNTIEIQYHTNLTNRLLTDGVITKKIFGQGEGRGKLTWWGNDVDYRTYGPKQAKVIPYVDEAVKATEAQKELDQVKEELDQVKEEVAAKEEAAKKAQEALAQAQKEAEERNKALAEANKVTEQQRKAAADAQAALAQAKKEAEAARAELKKAQEKADKLEFQAKKVKFTKLTSPKKSQAKATWKKVSGASGYQIQYATKSSFSGKKTLTVKSGKKTSAVIKKLKKGKKYYVRIRAYKKIAGKNVYTAYSAKKNVRVKK